MVEYRPANGSCARCRAALGTAALRLGARWYCSSSCADGKPVALQRSAVPEARLYGVPRRFFRARRPRELKPAAADSRARSS